MLKDGQRSKAFGSERIMGESTEVCYKQKNKVFHFQRKNMWPYVIISVQGRYKMTASDLFLTFIQILVKRKKYNQYGKVNN